ncbi:hypothetical protein TSTA_009650 [Talaromyces stipitatus ATCC 10500]|uniref:Uncharacterized protein n=1 Tax=Talaromyces stipitatus (strain ATCC 10500 / CBS 375.48 / QM 6759 / NRRL 1006) TaxID=441959 RepID=B8MFX7_TALSN|nr:uncharacterized protein TSTA_009650 [Talaromyces stipitatus ATCC 10500]EED15844.1 hypothetical protein TSTA_009650 [Talaromyces stipitatus ATCC 10500]
MAKEGKTSEEFHAKQAQSEATAARVKHEEDKRQTHSIEIDGCHALPQRLMDPIDGTSSSSETMEDVDVFDALSSLDEQNRDSGEDDIELDFELTNEDNLNPFEDLDEEISKFSKPSFEILFGVHSSSHPSPCPQTTMHSSLPQRELTPAHLTDTKPKHLELEPESKWTSHMQFIAFHATAGKIAEEYLKGKGVKLHSRLARSRKI